MKRFAPIALLVALAVPIRTNAVPIQIVQQGRLLDAAGGPVNGLQQLRVTLYPQETGGSPVWSDVFSVNFQDGYYTLVLGENPFTPLGSEVFNTDLYYGLTVGFAPELPRTPITSVPFAIRAASADSLAPGSTVDWSALTNTPDTLGDLSCSDGQIAQWDQGSSAWVCGADEGLTDLEVVGIVEGSPLNLDPNTLIGGEAVVTGPSYGDADVQTFVEGTELNLDGGTTIGGIEVSSGEHTTYDGSDFVTSGQECTSGRVVTGVDSSGNLTCQDATDTLHTGAVYRWTTFHTHQHRASWIDGNSTRLFGGVNPSTWTDGNAQANQMSPDMELIRTLFTRKGYAGANANVISDVYLMFSSTTAQMGAVLFRIENTTNSPITWTPHFQYTCYAGWSERASISLNRASNWNSGGQNCNDEAQTNTSLSIPANQISTVVFISGSNTTYSVSSFQERYLGLHFVDNSLVLPNGLRYIDDLDTATSWLQAR